MTKMTIEEATKLLKMSDQAIWLKGLEKEQRKAEEMAIKSLEAWEKVKKEIKQIRIHCGYLDVQGVTIIEVLEIIGKHLAEVEN